VGDLHSRLRRLEAELHLDADTLEMTDGSFVYVGAARVIDDYLHLAKYEEIDDERARLYADALDDARHGTMLTSLITRCQERFREEQ
jgi:hypothetical protein